MTSRDFCRFLISPPPRHTSSQKVTPLEMTSQSSDHPKVKVSCFKSHFIVSIIRHNVALHSDVVSSNLSFPGLIAFDEVTLPEVDKLLSNSSTKHCELDSSPVWLIKSLRHIFAPILLLLINCSLLTSTLPTSHKRAILRPRIKKPGLDLSDPSNYRPISNLSFISKLVERAVHRQLSNYVESNSLLPLVQSGFRRLHSTETAVLKVYNDIILALDSGFIAVLLLLDFSSAFDCVDHSILLKVLELQFGITASALLWIANFLTNRSHSVRLGTNTSKYFNILFGVPQGSILGPLLFILYTSNIVHIASKHGILIHLYADDTQLYIKLTAKDIDNAKSRLFTCFSDIQTWCASMRLKLNASKTELIWFNRHPTPTTDILHTVLNLGPDCSIKPVDVVRRAYYPPPCKLEAIPPLLRMRRHDFNSSMVWQNWNLGGLGDRVPQKLTLFGIYRQCFVPYFVI